MKNNAFTLQEALITIGIIGIVSAIVLPAVQKLTPDANKMKYMNTYNTLATLTKELFDEPAYYSIEYDDENNPTCKNLDCLGFPKTKEDMVADSKNVFKDATTWNKSIYRFAKFPILFNSKLGLSDTAETSTSTGKVDIYSQKDDISFHFSVSYSDNKLQRTDITIDVVPDSTNGTIKSEFATDKTINSVDNPEQFKFILQNNGSLKADDELGKAYLKNSTDMKNTKDTRMEARKKATKK